MSNPTKWFCRATFFLVGWLATDYCSGTSNTLTPVVIFLWIILSIIALVFAIRNSRKTDWSADEILRREG